MITRLLLYTALCGLSLLKLGAQSHVATATQPDNPNYLIASWQTNRDHSKAQWTEDYAKYFDEIYDDRYDYLLANLEEDHYLFHPALNGLLDSLVARLVSANAELSSIPIQILIGRYATPNAFSLGDGTIVINVGLLRRLESIEQLTFVIAHEIAHVSLKHLEHNLEDYLVRVNDKKKKKELDRLARREEVEEVLQILQTSLYDRRRHSRQDEADADALALNFLLAAGLPSNSSWECLGLLDSIDREKYPAELETAQLLTTTAYPFKERWLTKEELMFGGKMTNKEQDFWEIDSLRTHPDCRERIELLTAQKRQIATAADSTLLVAAQARTPNNWQRWADYEMVLGQLHFEQYGSALYHALKLRQEAGDDPLIHLLIGRALNEIYAASLVHQFDSSVPAPRSRPEEDWQELMRMLRKMRSREILNLAESYLETQQNRFPDYLPLRQELAVSKAHEVLRRK